MASGSRKFERYYEMKILVCGAKIKSTWRIDGIPLWCVVCSVINAGKLLGARCGNKGGVQVSFITIYVYDELYMPGKISDGSEAKAKQQ